jgi:hypothetical protein
MHSISSSLISLQLEGIINCNLRSNGDKKNNKKKENQAGHAGVQKIKPNLTAIFLLPITNNTTIILQSYALFKIYILFYILKTPKSVF